MDFDPRRTDDPRDRDDYGRELSQGSRGGLSNPREREPLDARDVFTRDLELPRGRERERVWARDSDVTLRGSEVRTLATVGAFASCPPAISATVRIALSIRTEATFDTCETRDSSRRFRPSAKTVLWSY